MAGRMNYNDYVAAMMLGRTPSPPPDYSGGDISIGATVRGAQQSPAPQIPRGGPTDITLTASADPREAQERALRQQLIADLVAQGVPQPQAEQQVNDSRYQALSTGTPLGEPVAAGAPISGGPGGPGGPLEAMPPTAAGAPGADHVPLGIQMLGMGIPGQYAGPVGAYLEHGPMKAGAAIKDLYTGEGEGGRWGAGTRLIQGAGTTALPAVAPFIAPAIAAAPLAMLGGLGAGIVGGTAAPRIAEQLGASPEQQEFWKEVGGNLDPSMVSGLALMGTKAAVGKGISLAAIAALPKDAAEKILKTIRLRPEDVVTLQPHPDAPAGVQPVNVERATDALSRRLVQQKQPGAYTPKNDLTILEPYKPGLPPLAVGRLTPEDWVTHRLQALDPEEAHAARKWYRELTAAFTAAFGHSDQANKQIAWAVSQQQASPANGLLNVLRVEQMIKGRQPIWWRPPSAEAQKAATRLRNATTAKDYLKAMQKVPEELRPLFPATRPTGDARAALDLTPQLQTLKPGLARDKIEQVLRGETIGGEESSGIGKKLSDFGDNVLGKTTRTYMGDDPRGGSPTAIDVWAGRDRGHLDTVLHKQLQTRYGDAAKHLQRDFGAIDNNRYEESLDFYANVAKHLNEKNIDGGQWTPDEVQAVGWTAMQRLVGEEPQNAAHMFRENTRQVAFELSFGDNSPFSHDYPPLHSLPYDVSAAITKEVGAKTVKLLADDAGVRDLHVFFGPGGYEHYPVQPSGQATLLAPPERVQDFIDSLGYVLNQTEVLASRPIKSGSRQALSVVFDAPESQLDAILPTFWSKLQAKLPGAFAGSGSGFSPAVEGGAAAMDIFHPATAGAWQDEAKLRTAISEVAADMGITIHGDKIKMFQADVLNSKNDWSANYEGQAYLNSLRSRGRSDLSERLEREHAPQVRRWVEDAFNKHAPDAIAAHRGGQPDPSAGEGTTLGASSLAGITFKGGSP